MILGTKANELTKFVGSIPDEQLVIVPDPTTGELFRSTFGQLKADIILAVGDISYLDQIIEIDQVSNLPQPGEVKKIYVITGAGPDQNKQFRWGGSLYIEFPAGSGDVAGEAIIRGNADAALNQRIDDEIQAREDADSTLQLKITAEALARHNGDSISAAQIAAETNARRASDSTLLGMINSEAQIRAQQDLALSQRIDEMEVPPPPNMDGGSPDVPGAIIQVRRGNALVWQQINPVLADGEQGWEYDTGKKKIGDGHTAWNDLPYESTGGGGPATTDELPEGTENLYFDTDRVLNTQLKDLAEDSQTNLEPTDYILTAFGKIKKFISSLLTSFNGPKQLVQLDNDGKYPALDGSLITNLPAGGTPHMAATGTNTYTITNDPAITAYPKSIYISFANANTSASTLKIDALSALPIRLNGQNLAANNILSNSTKLLLLADDSSHYQLQAGFWEIPAVASGEKVVTVKSDGLKAEYTVVNPLGITATTAAQLAGQSWAAAQSVTYTGKQGEKRFDNNYFYLCVSENTWWRMLFNVIPVNQKLGIVSDSGGVKTSAQMNALYPDAIPTQFVQGVNGKYEYMGIGVWYYYENIIAK